MVEKNYAYYENIKFSTGKVSISSINKG